MTIEKIERDLKTMQLPDTFAFGKHSVITNVPLFIESHIAVVKAHPKGSHKRIIFEPYAKRLFTFYLAVAAMQSEE
jgi:hypothetical protein